MRRTAVYLARRLPTCIQFLTVAAVTDAARLAAFVPDGSTSISTRSQTRGHARQSRPFGKKLLAARNPSGIDELLYRSLTGGCRVSKSGSRGRSTEGCFPRRSVLP